MNLDPDEEEVAAAEAFERLFSRECSLERVRETEDVGFDRLLWKRCLEIGIMQMAMPESFGGEDVPLQALGRIAEVSGHFLAPVPIIDSVVSARTIGRVGSPTTCERVSQLCENGTVVVIPVEIGRRPIFSYSGAIAQGVVGLRRDQLCFWELENVRLQHVENLASAPAALIFPEQLDSAPVTILTSGPQAAATLAMARAELQVLISCALIGLGKRALSIGVEYVKQREQFGQPIAKFQSIQHRLADCATNLRGSQLLAFKAAWAMHDAATHDGLRMSSLSYISAGRTAFRSAAEALHFHGGYGFTLEYDIQMFFRRAKGLAGCLDTQPRLMAEAATRVIEEERKMQAGSEMLLPDKTEPF